MITWEQSGIGYEADPRHVEIIIKDLGLEASDSVSTPGASTEGRTKDDHTIPLEGKEESQYKTLVARAKLHHT